MAGRTKARGYGPSHKARRAMFAELVEAGDVYCQRCGFLIDPDEPFDLGHDDADRSLPTYPEHRSCNRATAGRRRSPVRKPAAAPSRRITARRMFPGDDPSWRPGDPQSPGAPLNWSTCWVPEVTPPGQTPRALCGDCWDLGYCREAHEAAGHEREDAS